ncbi:hypothetical protein M2272_004026 [Mycobacterium frederiksbergense]|uniref:Uncharacterized protein n=1 Tax=Mycolicibacterium frederiksbergense TaxID=117567 RepID=A0ABT6L383_9MYCO|nr:hypothetical protein [Mycolicibacterium frederiksbergense]MDH6197373.1 hypothetical protein [Mycolicibacterium frederiksbergense]
MSPQTSPGAVPFTRTRVRPDKTLQYELNVVATSVADVVSGIGGWLFDRGMAGWRVNVAAGRSEHDERALRILGMKAVDLSGLWRSVGTETGRIAMMVIATDRIDSGDEVQLHRLTALGDSGQVTFFGSQCPAVLSGKVHPVQYRMSAAARAFKAQALAVAGGCPESVGAVETMFGYARATGPVGADLVPVC